MFVCLYFCLVRVHVCVRVCICSVVSRTRASKCWRYSAVCMCALVGTVDEEGYANHTRKKVSYGALSAGVEGCR